MKGVGTAVYNIKDDTGHIFQLTIPNTTVSPDVLYRHIAPQYLAEFEKKQYPDEEFQRGVTTVDIKSILYFDKGRRQRTIPHIKGCKVPAVGVNLGNSQYNAYAIAMTTLAQDESQEEEDTTPSSHNIAIPESYEDAPNSQQWRALSNDNATSAKALADIEHNIQAVPD